MAHLDTRAPPENKLAPCASSDPSPLLCAIGAIDAAREAPMALPLRHGSLPARYRANEENDHGLRKAFLKAPATQKAHEASALKKSLLRLTGKQQAEYSLPHENPAARFACWRQNSNIGRLLPLAGRGRPALHNTHYIPGAGGDIMMQKARSAARAYTGYRVV